jgi:hypothetical protein
MEPEKTLGRIETFREFWPYYLREHSDPACRSLHYLGTGLTLIALTLGILVSPWCLIAAPIAGYGFAWLAHFKFEKNKPATFDYPLWSLLSDFRMFFAWISGRLPQHLRDAGIASLGDP